MPTLELIRSWFDRYLGESESVFLALALISITVLILTLGTYLAPVLTSLVFAFALHGLIVRCVEWRVPRLLAVSLVMVLFLGVLVALLIGILPLVWTQLQQVIEGLPQFVQGIGVLLESLNANYPDLLPQTVVDSIISTSQEKLTQWGATLLQTTFVQLPNVIGLLIFVALTPITLFFFLKDHDEILEWFVSLLPKNRPRLTRIGVEMNYKITRYIRGKVIEIVIVGLATYIAFEFLSLEYAALLGLLVGISVLIPYIGAALVTIPVVIVALFQFGATMDFLYVGLIYAAIQILDGNVLVPLLFSEAVDLHPVTIIVAVLAFGGMWGIWGVFFAIPLATLIKAIFLAWTHATEDEHPESSDVTL